MGEAALTTGGETSRPGMEEEEGGHPETVAQERVREEKK